MGAGYTMPPRPVILDARDPYQKAANAIQQQARYIQGHRAESERNAAAFKAEMERRRADDR